MSTEMALALNLPTKNDNRIKLTTGEVRAIRALRMSGMTLAEIANRYHVHLSTIWQIVNGKTRKGI